MQQLVRRGSGKLLWVIQLINFVVVSAIGYAAGLLFFPNQPFVRLALLLTGLLAGSLLAPLYLKGLLGTVIDIPLTSVFMQILSLIHI